MLDLAHISKDCGVIKCPRASLYGVFESAAWGAEK